MKINYQWLQTFFKDGNLPPPEEVAELLTFHAFEVEAVEQVEGVPVVDVDVLPNRSSDALSHRGVARELATLLDVTLADDPLAVAPAHHPTTNEVSVTLGDGSCSYYSVTLIRGVRVGPSPSWLAKRLVSIGQKSVNNIVDATNYVMFALGQPTHAFDAGKLRAPYALATRRAKEGERIVLLGGQEAVLNASMTVIVDGTTDAPLAVAGVKGGTHAEVTPATTDVLIESAKFHPTDTRLTAQALRLRTDASTRFENNTPAGLAAYGAPAVAALIADIAGGTCAGYAACGTDPKHTASVAVSVPRVSALLGVSIPARTIENVLARLGFSFTKQGGVYTVTPPFERTDITIEEEVIEEIGRVHGYTHIPATPLPPFDTPPAVHPLYAWSERIRHLLGQEGWSEVYLYSLGAEGEVALPNALASDKNYLRARLAPAVEAALNRNEKQAPLLGLHDAVTIFEIGTIFTAADEHTSLCLGARALKGERTARTAALLARAKEKLEAFLGTALPELSGETLECNLTELVATLPPPKAYPPLASIAEGTAYTPLCNYPFALRDIAVWVPEGVSVDELKEMLHTQAGALLRRADCFDTFAKDGRVSYALRLVFQSDTHTLTDKEIGEVMTATEAALNARSGFTVR